MIKNFIIMTVSIYAGMIIGKWHNQRRLDKILKRNKPTEGSANENLFL